MPSLSPALARVRRARPLILALLCAPPVQAAEPPVPLAAFFDNPVLSGAKLSPDGRRLAMRVNSSNGYDRLGVVNLADMSRPACSPSTPTAARGANWCM